MVDDSAIVRGNTLPAVNRIAMDLALHLAGGPANGESQPRSVLAESSSRLLKPLARASPGAPCSMPRLIAILYIIVRGSPSLHPPRRAILSASAIAQLIPRACGGFRYPHSAFQEFPRPFTLKDHRYLFYHDASRYRTTHAPMIIAASPAMRRSMLFILGSIDLY